MGITTTLSLAAVLREAARRHPGEVAVVDGGAEHTYDALWADTLRHGAALRELGVDDGDRLALLAPNVTDFVRAYFGILAAGAVVVPVPTLLGPDEVRYLVEHSGARTLLAHPALTAVAERATSGTGVPVRDLASYAASYAGPPLTTYRSRAPEDPAVVFYTSGTTGRPKGAVLTHLNLVMNATVSAFDGDGHEPDDVVLASLPLFHTFGQSVIMNASFRRGGRIVLQPRFDADEALRLMVEHDVTIFAGVPTMFVQLVAAAEARPDGVPLPRLRRCGSGGAPLPVAVAERFEEHFGVPVTEGYGLSETSPTATTSQERLGTRSGTVGHAIWGCEVAVADPGTKERVELLPAGTVGEVVVRGHNVFAGYLDDPGATAESVVDGWFRTGDLGTQDAAGLVSIVDRVKDLVIRGGFNVYPREVEEVLLRHPAVGQVAVIGVPSETHGEEVCAVVVPAPGTAPDPAGLVAWAHERLGGHKYPRRVEVVEELPVGPSMKVLKRELRVRFT